MKKGNIDMEAGKAVCHKCGDSAKFNQAGKWWCGYTNQMAEYNLQGYCKKEKKGLDEKLNNNRL